MLYIVHLRELKLQHFQLLLYGENIFFLLKGKYHRNEIRFTNIVGLDYVTCLEEKTKLQQRWRWENASHRIHLAIRVRNCFLSLLGVIVLRISLSITLNIAMGGRTRWLHIIPLFPKMIDDALSRWATSFLDYVSSMLYSKKLNLPLTEIVK